MDIFFILIFAYTLHHISCEVKLYQGFNESVKFSGNDLMMLVKNPENTREQVTLCFESQSDSESLQCPKGFAEVDLFLSKKFSNLTHSISRDGVISFIKDTIHLRFNPDGSLKLFVLTLSKNVEVILQNADIVVGNASKKSTKFNKTTIALIVCGVLLIFLVLGAMGVTLYCLLRQNRTHTVVPTLNPKDHNVNENIPPAEATINRHQQNQVTPSNEDSATPVTKKTSTSTTKPSDEKIQPLILISKKSSTKTPLLASVDCPKTVSQATSVETVVPVSSTKTPRLISSRIHTSKRTSKSKVVRKTSATLEKSVTTARSEASLTAGKKLHNPSSPILVVDKTQSPTEQSPTTLVTPKFGEDATAKELANNSAFKAREYVPRHEAPVPGSKKPRRVAPIVDEVAQYRFFTETYLCYGQRTKTLSGHDHMRIVDRIKVTIQHVPSDAERILLKAAPQDAPRLANIVVKEAHEALNKYATNGDYNLITFDENPQLWAYINNPATPASVGYVVLYHLLPNIFKLDKMSLSDARVRVMPLCGLYTLLLDTKLTYDFRVQLATELRNRATCVIARLQMDALREAAFPTSYLVRIYYKNSRSFIKCLEIHSKASK